MGFWQGNTYVKIHTPEVIAYHNNNEQLYLAPNLKMGTLTKDIHSLYPSKPCVCDYTKGICGLESIKLDTSCPAEATPRSQVEVTQAKIIGNRWLVNTPARTAILTYDQHDTTTRISLPNQTLWITVPKGAILHNDELALYYIYHLVEPLTIKPIKMTQLSIILNKAFLCLFKFLTCSFPNYPAPVFSQW